MTFFPRALRTTVALAALVTGLSGCAQTELVSHWVKQVDWPSEGKQQDGLYKVGRPYMIDGVRYVPQENFRLVETGIASWYGPGFHAQRTANGEKFDQHELTGAHRTLQLPSIARVTNLENGRSVVIRINDRGPFKHGRIMDVSQRAAELLGFANVGTARVRLEVLEQESRMAAAAARRGETEVPTQVASVSAPAPSEEDTGGDSLPESLRTPTITVEELSHAPRASSAPPPATLVAQESLPPPPSGPAPGRVDKGRFLPAPVVSGVPVAPTGIFVQAGSFAVRENAERLKLQLSKIAPTLIEPVTVGGRSMYRVKLGPISSVEKADAVLEKVIHAGQGAAKVIRSKK